MRVLVVAYKAEISGGSNRSMLSVIDVLLEHKHEVILLLPKRTGVLYQEAAKRNVKCIYMPYSRIGAKRTDSWFKNNVCRAAMKTKLLRDKLYTKIHYQELKKLDLDIVYTNGSAIHAGRLISHELGIPHVWHIREFFENNQLLPKHIYQIMCKRTDRFILISHDMLSDYAAHINPDKLEMISNGIKYVEQPALVEHSGINILLTGRITEAKCQLDAVKAIQNLKDTYSDIVLHFAGQPVSLSDETYKKVIIDYINDNQLQKQIKFLGEVKNMSELRKNMDIELMCSSREAFGRVTVEAMRSGLAVIGTNSGGTKDIIIDGYNGIFYEAGNIEDLSSKLALLFSDRRLMKSIAANGKKFSREHFVSARLN